MTNQIGMHSNQLLEAGLIFFPKLNFPCYLLISQPLSLGNFLCTTYLRYYQKLVITVTRTVDAVQPAHIAICSNSS